MEWKDKKVLVIGTGISGIAASDLLMEVGAKVILFDANEATDCDTVKAKLKKSEGVQLIVGTLEPDIRDLVEYVVISPGVPIDNPLVNELRDAGKVILGEVELAYSLSEGKIAAITGTNGKTTTTALVGEILKAHYFFAKRI